MKILASSVDQAAGAFLHAGYMSACPRGLDGHSIVSVVSTFDDAPTAREVTRTVEFPPTVVSLDMVAALRLEGEDVTAGGTVAVPPRDAGSLAQFSAWPFQLTVSCLFFLIVGVFYVVRHQRQAGRNWKRWAVGLFGAAAIITIIVLPASLRATSMGAARSVLLPPDTVPPWEGVALRDYAEPEQATLAIMHGLVADALSSVPAHVKTLAQIQSEVGIPSARLTEGQRYALKTYGLDGWGNPLRLSEDGVAGMVASADGLLDWHAARKPAFYVLTSAGRDGAFDSEDDIVVTVDVATEYSWDVHRHAFYIRKDGNEPVLLYHRWAGRLFRHNEASLASRLTGTNLFDAVNFGAVGQTHLSALDERYSKVSAGLPYEPVVLQVFEKKEEGVT